MLTFYFIKDDKIESLIYEEGIKIDFEPIWIDLHEMTREEELFVENMFNINIPSREEMHELELSSRLYNKGLAVYMTTSLVTKVFENDPEIHSVTFVLYKEVLITIRYCDPKAFIHVQQLIKTLPLKDFTAKHFYAYLVDSIIERSADVLWHIGEKTDLMAKDVFRKNEEINYKTKMTEIGHLGDLSSKITESLVTLSRMVHYILQSSSAKIDGEVKTNLIVVSEDIKALSDHANFLSNKITFLLDATLGLINIEQNNIIKIFSVAAVISLPPTLVATIYGMNFSIMPELSWKFGYPFSIILMIISGWLPFKYFKKKKWL